MASRRSLWLDYGEHAEARLLRNLSAIAFGGGMLWTASDEGRTLECLTAHRRGFRLARQFRLDDCFPDLPGAAKKDEADIEALAFSSGRLYISGSHCWVRRPATKNADEIPGIRTRSRPSRNLLGELAVDRGMPTFPGRALSFEGPGSLREFLSRIPYFAPFLELPSKENGLDIEGIAVLDRRLFIGCRGPVIDSTAMCVEVALHDRLELRREGARLHFLDMGGLGIRDMTTRQRSARTGWSDQRLHWSVSFVPVASAPGRQGAAAGPSS